MAEFKLTILGSNSAVPAHNRNPSAQILKHHSTSFLIDCGEATQFQMNKFHIKRGKLDYILISHMHGDHYFGLVGLLNTLNLNGRKTDLNIFGPPELEQIILLQTDYKREDWNFKINFTPMTFGESYLLFETKNLEVFTIPLDHRVPCNGFLFKEKKKARKINIEAIEQFNIPKTLIKDIKNGADYVDERGNVIKHENLTSDAKERKTYAYCSDTKYNERIIPIIKNVDLVYHEATFLKEDDEKAVLRFHSTTHQAGIIAKKANAKKLIIGHFSARYANLNVFLNEVQEVFPNSAVAIEGEEHFI